MTRARPEARGDRLGAAALAGRLVLGEAAGVALTSRGRGAPAPIGGLRRFVGGDAGGAVELLALRLELPALGLYAERLYAFAPPASARPHLTLGLTRSGAPGSPGIAALVADLAPRVDLAVNPAYVAQVYAPLERALAELEATRAGDEALALIAPRRGQAAASPFALAARIVDGAGAGQGPVAACVEPFVDRWCALAEARFVDLFAPAPAQRERRLRAALVEPRADPLFAELPRLCEEAEAVVAAVAGGDGPA
ncbi:MAG: hypothetical protein R3A79_16655 [Nannocystaceae bacterium]